MVHNQSKATGERAMDEGEGDKTPPWFPSDCTERLLLCTYVCQDNCDVLEKIFGNCHNSPQMAFGQKEGESSANSIHSMPSYSVIKYSVMWRPFRIYWLILSHPQVQVHEILCTGKFMHRHVHAQVCSCSGKFMHGYAHSHVKSCKVMSCRGILGHIYIHAQGCSCTCTFMHIYFHAQVHLCTITFLHR